MGAGHDHSIQHINQERPMWWALGLTVLLLMAEVAGGLLTNSLALLSDAAHMGTDATALCIALAAVRMWGKSMICMHGRRAPRSRYLPLTSCSAINKPMPLKPGHRLWRR